MIVLDASGWVEFELGEFDEAEKYFAQVLEKIPGHQSATTGMFVVRVAQGRAEEARVLQQQILEENRRDPRYLKSLEQLEN